VVVRSFVVVIVIATSPLVATGDGLGLLAHPVTAHVHQCSAPNDGDMDGESAVVFVLEKELPEDHRRRWKQLLVYSMRLAAYLLTDGKTNDKASSAQLAQRTSARLIASEYFWPRPLDRSDAGNGRCQLLVITEGWTT
jgi:hypothetical protein